MKSNSDLPEWYEPLTETLGVQSTIPLDEVWNEF